MWMIELAINTMMADNTIGSQSAASETMRTSSVMQLWIRYRQTAFGPRGYSSLLPWSSPLECGVKAGSKISPIEDRGFGGWRSAQFASVSKPAALLDHFSGALLLGVCDLAWSEAQRCGAPQGTVSSSSTIPVHWHRRPL